MGLHSKPHPFRSPTPPPLRRPDPRTLQTSTIRRISSPAASSQPPTPRLRHCRRDRIFVSQRFSVDDVSAAVKQTSPKKAPGSDQILNALLRACGDSLFTWLSNIAATSLRLGHWPSHFKRYRTIVIPKPGKTGPEVQVKGWRPIALIKSAGSALLGSPILTYAILCSPMLSYAHLCSPVLACARLCSGA